MDKFKITKLNYVETASKAKCLSLKTEIKAQIDTSTKDHTKGLVRIAVKISNGDDVSDPLNLSVETVSLFSVQDASDQDESESDNIEEILKNKCFPVAYTTLCKSFENITNEVGMEDLRLPELDDFEEKAKDNT